MYTQDNTEEEEEYYRELMYNSQNDEYFGFEFDQILHRGAIRLQDDLDNAEKDETLQNNETNESHIDEEISFYPVLNRSDGLIRPSPILNSPSPNILRNNSIISQNIIQNLHLDSYPTDQPESLLPGIINSEEFCREQNRLYWPSGFEESLHNFIREESFEVPFNHIFNRRERGNIFLNRKRERVNIFYNEELENGDTEITLQNININERHIAEEISFYRVLNRSDGLIRPSPILNSPSSNIMRNNSIIYQNIIQNPQSASEINNTTSNFLNQPRPKIGPFGIKIDNYIGRYPKAYSNKKDTPGVHTKHGKDNILNVIITHGLNNYIEYLNIMLRKSKDSSINKIKLEAISLGQIKYVPVLKQIEILNKENQYILSGKLNGKYSRKEPDYNEKMIKKIMESDDENIKNEMTKNGWYIFEIYSKKKQDINFKEMKTIDDDIEHFLEKGEDISYIEKYREKAENFEANIRKKKPRNKKK